MTLRVQITYFVNHIKYGQTVKFKDNSQFQWHLFLLIKFHLRFPFCVIKENCFQDFHLIIFKQKHKTDVTHQQKLNVKYHSHVSLLASGAAVVSKAKKNAPSLFYRIEFYKEKKTPSLSMWEYFYNKSYLCSVTDMKLDWKTEVLMLNLSFSLLCGWMCQQITDILNLPWWLTDIKTRTTIIFLHEMKPHLGPILSLHRYSLLQAIMTTAHVTKIIQLS